jgi:hypothetical protein
VGAQYCRGYACDDATRRHFDPLYDAAVAFEEFRDSVGMGISVGAANTLLAMNSPGHMTPEAEAEYYVQPTNRTERVVSAITEVVLLVGIPVALKELAPARSEPSPTGIRVEGRGAGPKPALEPVPTTTKPTSEPIVRGQADIDAGVASPEQTRLGVLRDDKSVRDQLYPSRTRKSVREGLERKATDAEGNIRCQGADCDVPGGRIIEPGKGSPDHDPKLVETHNTVGFNTDQPTRNALFNQTTKKILCINCQKKQGGATTETYRRDVGPNFKPRPTRRTAGTESQAPARPATGTEGGAPPRPASTPREEDK